MITRKLILGIADATVSVDGRDIYSAEDLRVGLFTSTDGFWEFPMRRVVITGMGIVSCLGNDADTVTQS